jgi:mannose-6-phosphate isomerase
MYDWNRVDKQGKSRELHTEQALDAIDFTTEKEYATSYVSEINKSSNLATCDYFTTNHLAFDTEITKDYTDLDSFVIYICLDGEFEIDYKGQEKIRVKKGESILIPSEITEITLIPFGQTECLEVYI